MSARRGILPVAVSARVTALKTRTVMVSTGTSGFRDKNGFPTKRFWKDGGAGVWVKSLITKF